MQIIYTIINKICFFFDFYILRHLRKIYYYVFCGMYIEDNMRNKEYMQYCIDVACDDTRQPKTIYEHKCEDILFSYYEELMYSQPEAYNALLEAIPDDTLGPEAKHRAIYELLRQQLALHFGKEMDSLLWVDTSKR